ncbi:2,3-bisphosphoglycerate-independent phosphoglycerate mutase [Candidatus Beckwithbacteria bacterium]|nr:2,3-bisphosphoglycerate-independent phosphoglycerate mutase [Candidatus Beckwithbacteria bacterium]
MSKNSKAKVMLIIRDGWGYRHSCELNAICEAKPSFDSRLMQQYPHTLLAASGEAVGLPEGFQGNSEVGHMTIGGGRIMFQSMVRIDKAISDGSFFKNDMFLKAIANCKKYNSTLHLIGLLQVEGVHAHINHLFALLDLCQKQNFKNVLVHVITDGRDAPVHDSLKHLRTLEQKLKKLGFGQVATISGRYFAMDRDQRWDRTQKAYDCLTQGQTQRMFEKASDYIHACHSQKETDEFIVPGKISWYEGIKNHDSVIFYNFRTDRPRQLTQALVEPKFDHFPVQKLAINYVTMTQYYQPMKADVAFAEIPVVHFLGELVSQQGLKQLRISETEKYAHVTFFFNGQIEKPFTGEERVLIPSPKVATYDLKPEMSVGQIADALVNQIRQKDYSLVVTNLVNGDMVGHTGIRPAIRKAVLAVDQALEQIVIAGLEQGYTILVFADHGNAEDQTPKWRTSHTTNPVPCILVSNDPKLQQVKLKEGRGLQDIAPTTLKLLGITKPKEMSGESLV